MCGVSWRRPQRTRLSKSLVDRTLTNAKGKAIKVAKGQVIGCDLCHTMAKSFVGSPTGVATDHPAPKPETFVISNKPAPTTPATGGTGTTGGMGGMTMSH